MYVRKKKNRSGSVSVVVVSKSRGTFSVLVVGSVVVLVVGSVVVPVVGTMCTSSLRYNKDNSLALFDTYEFLQRKMNRILTCMAVCLLLMERVR